MASVEANKDAIGAALPTEPRRTAELMPETGNGLSAARFELAKASPL
jgi:hypothetical protein